MPARAKKAATQKSEVSPLAYSYIRFSTSEQAKGDSLRRQTEKAAEWCSRNNMKLDTSTTLHDLGRSAFLGEHRTNADRCALAAFLKLVEGGKVPRGSALIVESLDRLSREHIRPALTLLLQLIDAGVKVVQLMPVETVYDERVEPMALMMAIMELSRGHSESKVKSERVGGAWAQKKAFAREGKPQPEKRNNRVNGMKIITHQLPAWLEEIDGKPVVKPKAAAAVRRVFELARGGYGNVAIAKKLSQEKVSPISGGKEWSRSYIAKILSTRQALGEFQPHKRDGSPDGDPILNYFPAVVTEAEWQAARAAAATRRQPGRQNAPANGSLNNIFAGLVTDARDGGSYYATQRVDGNKPGRGGRRQWVLINTRSAEGRAPCVSFPLQPFERGILTRIREIDEGEILGTDGPPSEVAELAAELAREETEIAAIEAALEKGGQDIPSVTRVLGKKEKRRRELAERLAVARAAEANPVSASWGEFKSVYQTLDAAPDREEAKRRLRTALRRIVSGIWLLAVPRGRTRVAAVRIVFVGREQARDYLLVYSPAKSNGVATVPASLKVYQMDQRASLWNDAEQRTELTGLDIRERKDATALAKVLARWNVAEPLSELADERDTPLDVKIWLNALTPVAEWTSTQKSESAN